jgi:hypothetical protein
MDIFTSDITKNSIIPDRNEGNINHDEKKEIHKVCVSTYREIYPSLKERNFQPPDNVIYRFNNNMSTNVNFDILSEYPNDIIPKISFKELPILSYSLTDKFDLTTINMDIFKNYIPKESIIFYENKDNVNLYISNEYSNDKIPKISFKEELYKPSYSLTDKFDLTKINQKISTPINMDIFKNYIPKETIVSYENEDNVKRLKKKGIHKIFHVYQEKYADNLFPTGFGDFIRSCFFIIQFCSKYGFGYEIIINHPIAQFLNKFSSNYSPNSICSFTLNNKVFMFSQSNWSKSVFDNFNYIQSFVLIKQKFNLFIDYLCSLPIVNGSVFSYNILFPYDYISLEECNKIRSLFEPSREIIEKVNYHLSNLSLIENQFIVLHIRSGDSYLKNQIKLFDSPYFEIIKNEINKIILKEKLISILLISDNNEIKLLLNDEFPNIKFLVYNITHLGEGIRLENEKVQNTMIDFYLMSKSSAIYSLTSYPHGSGFSYWCAKIYGIPYKCKYITP